MPPRRHRRPAQGAHPLCGGASPAHSSPAHNAAGDANARHCSLAGPPERGPSHVSSSPLQSSSQSLSPQSLSAALGGRAQLSRRLQGRRRRCRWRLLCVSSALVVLVALTGLLGALFSARTSNSCGISSLCSRPRGREATATTVGSHFARASDESLSPAPPDLRGTARRASGTGDALSEAGGATMNLAASSSREVSSGADDSDAVSSAVAKHDTIGQRQHWHRVGRSQQHDQPRCQLPMDAHGVAATLKDFFRPSLGIQVTLDSASTTQVDPAADRRLMHEGSGKLRGVDGDGDGHSDERDYPSRRDMHHGRRRGAVESTTLPAEEAFQGENTGEECIDAGVDGSGGQRAHRYREEEDDGDADEMAEYVEEVYGESEARVYRGWDRYEGSQERDAHAPFLDGSCTRLRTTPSWWLSHRKPSTSRDAAPSSGALSASAASTAVNREIAPRDRVALDRERNSQTRWRGYRASYPTLREIALQLTWAYKEEQRVKQSCLSAMMATATACYDDKTSGNGTSGCWGGLRGVHDATNGSGNEPSPKAATTSAKCAALPSLRTSLDWVRYLAYVPVYPIEEALDHLEHKRDDDILLALFYAPDLFKTYNYVQWIGLMVKATCSLLRAGALDPITHIRDDDGDADGVFSTRVPSSSSTAAMRDTGNSSSSGGDRHHARRPPPLFCRDLVLPSLGGILTPGDLRLMRDSTVRVAIIDSFYPRRSGTRTLWPYMGRDTCRVHRRYWDLRSDNGGDENGEHDEADVVAAAEMAEVPAVHDVGSGGKAGRAGVRGKLQTRAGTAESSSSCASTESPTLTSAATAEDPTASYRTDDFGPAFVKHRNALLRMLTHEGDLPDDIRETLKSTPSLGQRKGAASTAEVAEDEARDARAQHDQGGDDNLHDGREQQVLQQRHNYRPYAHKDATVQTEAVTGAETHRAEVQGQETPITTASTNTSAAGASSLPVSSSLSAEETRLCPNDRGLFLARSIIDHPSVPFDVLQRSVDRVRQQKQRLVKKIFSRSQTMKYQLHANVSVQCIREFSSGHQCNSRYRAMSRLSGAFALAPGGGDTGGEADDEETVGDDVSGVESVQSDLCAEASCLHHQRWCNSCTLAALGSASALQFTKKGDMHHRHASSPSPWTGPAARLSTPKQQHHAASATPPLSTLLFRHNSSDWPLSARHAPRESRDWRATDTSVAATLKACRASAQTSLETQGDLGKGGGSNGAEFQHGEVRGELEGEVADVEGDAHDACGTSALQGHYIHGMYELEPENSFAVLRAQGGAAGRSTTKGFSVRASAAASAQGAGSVAAGRGDANRGAADMPDPARTKPTTSSASDRLCLPGTGTRRNCVLRQSPPVLLFPRKQGSRPYLFPQTLLRLLYLSFPEPRGQLPPDEHAHRMQLRWGCTPAANASSGEGVEGKVSRPTGGAVTTDDVSGDDGKGGKRPNRAWTTAEGEGQPRSNLARSGSRPYNGSDSSSADIGEAPSSASGAASLTVRPTSSTYRVISVIDNPFSRIGAEHLHYNFMIHGPSSPSSIVQLLVEESRRASTPGELETRTWRELIYRLLRRQWMEARAAAASAAAASGDGESEDDDGGRSTRNTGTGGPAEAEARPCRGEATSSSSHNRPKHATRASDGHDEPRRTTENHRPKDRLLRSRQPPLNSSARTASEAEEYFFEHDASFRLDPGRFIESAPLTLHFFLRTPTHVVEEELIQPLRQQVKALRHRLLNEIIRQAYRYGRCEIGGNRFMQLLAHGGSAVLASGTRLSALTKKRAPAPMVARWLGENVRANTRSRTSGDALDDNETSSVPYSYTDDDKPLLHSLRGSAALSVWRLTADLQRQPLHTLRASPAGASAPVSNPPSNDDETRDHIPLPLDLISLVELLHQPYDALHRMLPQLRQPELPSAFHGLSASLTANVEGTVETSTDDARGAERAAEENTDNDDDGFGVGLPSFLSRLVGWAHRAVGLEVSHGRSAAGRRASPQHRLLRERLSLLQVAVRELLRRAGPQSTNSFIHLISIEPEAAQLVEPLSTQPSELATSTTTTTAPTDGSTLSSPQPPECLRQYNATYLAVTYLFFNGTAEAYFRTHPLNQRRMHLLHRLDEAVRLSRKARLILLEATEEDYQAHYVDTVVHDATQRFCTFRNICPPRESWQPFSV